MNRETWIACCAHRLHYKWRSLPPEQLDEAAAELWDEEKLREMPPEAAAAAWLGPITDVPF